MKNRDIGLMLISISALFSVLVWLFRNSLTSMATDTCSHENVCPMSKTIMLQTNIGIVFIVFIVLLGLYIMFFAKENTQVIREVKIIKQNFKPKKLDKKQYSKIMNSLDKNEKSIVKYLLENKGSVFQSKLAETLNLSRVKITRVLDRLESKGIIERRRRGMTNVVFLKE